MLARIAKLEADVGHIQSDIREIKSDLKDVKHDARIDFRLQLGAMIVVAVGLVALMARGFGWLT